MNIRKQKLIKEYITRKTNFLCEKWYEIDDWEKSYISIINDIWWDGGFDSFCLPKEKENFYRITQQALEIILDYAHTLGESMCCVGPFHRFDNYEHWVNKEEYDCFNELKSHIEKDEYLLIDFESNKELLGIILENNFRYLSKISIYFPKTDILLEPGNHTEIFVYAKNLNVLKEDLYKVISPKGWKIAK